MEKIRQLKAVYDLDLGAEDSHRLTEDGGEKNA
jgi:hypothetical protein